MKYELPKEHGLSTLIQKELLFRDKKNDLQLTDVQQLCLEAGVGRGESVLVVSPTSTGKTLIGLWAIARCLQASNNAVYLVTHRALAKQKFEELSEGLAKPFLAGDKTAVVLATGDRVID